MHIPHTVPASLGQRWRLITAALTGAVLASMVWLAAPSLAATSGRFQIRAVHSDKCMDVRGGTNATADYTPVQQYQCLSGGQTNQWWYFHQTGDGSTFYVTAQNSGKCLDVRGGTGATGNGVALQQYTCLGYAQSNQRWYLLDSPDRMTFNLVAAHSGRCADVTGGIGATGDYIPVQQYDCLGLSQTNQRWYLSTGVARPHRRVVLVPTVGLLARPS
jgi:hypothetical protein